MDIDKLVGIDKLIELPGMGIDRIDGWMLVVIHLCLFHFS